MWLNESKKGVHIVLKEKKYRSNMKICAGTIGNDIKNNWFRSVE